MDNNKHNHYDTHQHHHHNEGISRQGPVDEREAILTHPAEKTMHDHKAGMDHGDHSYIPMGR